ncbi:MAG TPA: YqcC family protein [Sedimenticola thiotaurini]|uniref:YqcC family protein n=1 Tax=Sedimenticola thiotaurini TaxID=1543721 RepID=A0A831RI80_9GAMM|nr:YqcC family protein [Sedimenticola thiotaurini]
MGRRNEVDRLVQEMEHEMRLLGIWSSIPPSAEALASEFPFCYDTLQFDQWLQWVFLPRIHAVLDAGAALPAASDIAPLAEVWFIEQEMAQEAARLVGLIRRFDQVISGQ